MRVMMPDLFNRLAQGAGVLALVALVWGIAIPNGVFFTVALAVGLAGAATATGLLVRSRQAPTLAQMITTETTETGPVLVPSPGARRASDPARRGGRP
jgi:hypothetical protein